MKPRIYADTSVIGGCLDAEWRKHSTVLLDRFKSGRATIVVSDLTLLELSLAPPAVQKVLDDVPAKSREDIQFTREASDLADEYLGAGVIGPKSLVDARRLQLGQSPARVSPGGDSEPT